MVAACVVFTLVIRKIFLSRMPSDIICILGNFITHPKVSHFHASRSLALNGIIGNADGGRVFAMNWVPGLRMAEFLEGESKNHALFAIEEEGPEFGFCSRCDDET